MDMYQSQGKSIPQRVTLAVVQTVILAITGWLMFGGERTLNAWLGWKLSPGDGHRQLLLFILFLVVYLRITFMVFYLLKRSISWSESLAIPFAFALYYIGFALFSQTPAKPLIDLDVVYVLLFLLGSWINTFSEWRRYLWKQHPQNTGKLYTQGLFRFSMHINYFGDVLDETATRW